MMGVFDPPRAPESLSVLLCASWNQPHRRMHYNTRYSSVERHPLTSPEELDVSAAPFDSQVRSKRTLLEDDANRVISPR